MNQKKKFVIIDQLMKGFGGHHFNYTSAIYQEAQKSGFDPVIVANKNLNPDVFPKGMKIHPFFGVIEQKAQETKKRSQSFLFQILFYFLRVFSIKTRGDLFIRLVRIREKLDFLKKNQSQLFGDQLFQTIKDLSLHKNDVIFCHTLNHMELAVVLKKIALQNPETSPTTLLFVRDEIKSLITRSKIFTRLQKIKESPFHSKVSLFVDTEYLQTYFKNYFKVKAFLAPIPLFLPSNDEVNQKRKPENSELIIGYLGHARSDKGIHYFPEMIEKILPLLIKNEVKLLIQWNEGNHSKLENLQKIFQILSCTPNVELRDGAFSKEEYFKLLSQCDLILIPYAKDMYRYRSSGIFAEAMALEKISLVPDSTWMSYHQVDSEDIIFLDPGQIGDKIIKIKENKEDLLLKVKAKKKDWLAFHNPEVLFQTLINSGSSFSLKIKKTRLE